MLGIKQVKRYACARYPKGTYYVSTDMSLGRCMRQGITYSTLLLLLQSCDKVGTTGPPPVKPEMVTENEARVIIEKVFSENGIELENDVPYKLLSGREVILDGYNESMKIDYEYLSCPADTSFTEDIISELTDSTEADIAVVEEEVRDEEFEQRIEHIIQEFIESLTSLGII